MTCEELEKSLYYLERNSNRFERDEELKSLGFSAFMTVTLFAVYLFVDFSPLIAKAFEIISEIIL